MLVFVINKEGKPLMPCKPAKARLLLKQGKAQVCRRTPFTIQLQHGSAGYVQPVTLGVDSGFLHVGLSAVSEKKELYSADVELRNDIVKLNSERRMYRRSRRNRKTWYRQPRFDNRKKRADWLAPSIQHKLDSHLKLIEGVKRILPISKTIIEVAAFDIQKIKNPVVAGADYQKGDQAGFWNVREYVLYRDGHRCQMPGCKHKDPILNVHHIESRQTGGDRPNNLITLCGACHDGHHQGKVVLKIKPAKGFKAETFMSLVRWRLVDLTGASHTYGYLTKSGRISLKIEKSHCNDAFLIAGGKFQPRAESLLVRQVRKSNRKLFKGDHSHLKNTAPRLVHGFQRYDKIKFHGREGFIFGRRSTGYFDIRTLDGTKLHASAKAADLKMLERAQTFLIERRKARIAAS